MRKVKLWKSKNQGIKEETFMQTNKRGRDRQPGQRGCATRWQLVDQARWWLVHQSVPHWCVGNWEEQLGRKTDQATQGPSAGK